MNLKLQAALATCGIGKTAMALKATTDGRHYLSAARTALSAICVLPVVSVWLFVDVSRIAGIATAVVLLGMVCAYIACLPPVVGVIVYLRRRRPQLFTEAATRRWRLGVWLRVVFRRPLRPSTVAVLWQVTDISEGATSVYYIAKRDYLRTAATYLRQGTHLRKSSALFRCLTRSCALSLYAAMATTVVIAIAILVRGPQIWTAHLSVVAAVLYGITALMAGLARAKYRKAYA